MLTLAPDPSTVLQALDEERGRRLSESLELGELRDSPSDRT